MYFNQSVEYWTVWTWLEERKVTSSKRDEREQRQNTCEAGLWWAWYLPSQSLGRFMTAITIVTMDWANVIYELQCSPSYLRYTGGHIVSNTGPFYCRFYCLLIFSNNPKPLCEIWFILIFHWGLLLAAYTIYEKFLFFTAVFSMF